MKQTITETTTLSKEDIIDLILHSFKNGTKIIKGLKSIPESLTLQHKTVTEETKEDKEAKEASQSHWQDFGILHKEAQAVQDNLNADFCEACERGDVKAVQDLLSKGADIHHLNDFGIRFACNRGHTEVVKLLLEAGANVHDNFDEFDEEPILTACRNGHAEVMKVLLEGGADPDAHEVLLVAVQNGHTEIVKLLLEAGADVGEHNKEKLLNCADTNGYDDIFELLEEWIEEHG